MFLIKSLNKTIIGCLFGTIAFTLFSGILYQSSFAQGGLGLAPVPTLLRVNPTYVVDIPAGAVSTNASIHYVPPKISIPTGTTVVWFNDDPGQIHTVTSGFPKSSDSGKLFNSGIMPEGSFFQLTFMNPGEYVYHCTLHPYMYGIVHVGDSSETGHFFKITSGASIVPNNNTSSWTFNKTEDNRILFNFKPLNLAVDETTPLVYNLKIKDNKDGIIFDNNFKVLGTTDLQTELISSNINNTNVYGPDFTDPITGAFHIERNFADGDYTMTIKLVSVGTKIVADNIADEFNIKFVS